MIRVEEIIIKEFRGIRDLTLKLQEKNFAVCGPNGTGKSGVVDAIEFALTGNISRLSGKGTGDISVKEHGPHVDSSKKPENAAVSVKVYIPSLKTKATIKRTVKSHKNPKIEPDTPEVRAVLEQAQAHPEFALSRREIIKYVLTEPGSRAKDVQTLLRLDDIETLRAGLQKIANATSREAKSLKQGKANAAAELARVMAIPQAVEKQILDAANERRKALSLPLITKLEATTSLKDGLATSAEAATPKIDKKIALDDCAAARKSLEEIGGKALLDEYGAVSKEIVEFGKAGVDVTSREQLLQSALKLYDEQLCPVCDTAWEPAKFRKLLQGKLTTLEEVTKKKNKIVKQLEEIVLTVEKHITPLRSVFPHATRLSSPLKLEELMKYGQTVATALKQVKLYAPTADTADAIKTISSVPKTVVEEMDKLEQELKKLPDASQQDAAKAYLVAAQERLEAYRQAALAFKKAEQEAGIAASVFEIYGQETTAALEAIYKDVKESFIELYRAINEDEGKFEAKLEPSIGKLSFDVDFYGRGFFPPGAYHSEGHQDGMGLCLYLALMKHLLGKNFTFAVLDDVLMSVDTGHRREVSKMLRKFFPDTQFILTTHDPIWLRHMKSAGLIQGGSHIQFRKWSVETGPAEWDDRDVWKEIAGNLDKNDVRAAAALLRHFLEHIAHELCDTLRARVEFRGDAQYTLGDLFPNGVSMLKDYLKEGKAVAQSWGKTAEFDKIMDFEKAFQAALAASNAENWQVNAAVHYNEWENLGKKEFAAVVEAYRTLIGFFSCQKCQSLLFASPSHGNAETLRCYCGEISINLIKKKKGAAA